LPSRPLAGCGESNWINLEPLPNYLTDRAQRQLNIAAIDVEMGDHAHSPRIHRATEDMALPQSLEKL
jgi:hypothetical protein